jgi:ABC-type proline/glycine betaine transport system permease subunit
VVNGRTGRVQGERPWSMWKIALATLAGLIVAGGIGYAIAVSEGKI